MANKSYYEIRATSKLIDYDMKFAGKHPIWIETYKDESKTYRAIFSPDSLSHLPSTITQTNDQD
jgi:hypothetical protein